MEALATEAGVIFDDRGVAWPADPAYFVRRLGITGAHVDAITLTVQQFGFVHVAPIRDALLVKFEPSAVCHLAAYAAFYEIAGRAPKRLILAYPGKAGGSDRYEIFNDLTAGLKRVEIALARNVSGPAHRRRGNLQADHSGRQPRQEPALRPGPTAGSGVVRLAVNVQAENSSERLCRPLDSIAPEDGWFGDLLDIWHAARIGWQLPSPESFDPLEVVNISCGRAHVVDARTGDPEGYRFRVWGKVNPYPGDYKNRTLAQMPAGLMRRDAIEDYWEVTMTGLPTYHLFRRTEDRHQMSYSRLLLPLATNGRRVDQLLVLINQREISEFNTLGSGCDA
jgi:hypothetical protein